MRHIYHPQLIRRAIAALLPLLMSLSGCGSSEIPSGCPKDLSIPADMQILGSKYDSSLFILRLKTEDHTINEVVSLFKEAMKEDEWEIKVDSATDRGGELEFKKESRKCHFFVAHEKESENVKIDITCDRESVR